MITRSAVASHHQRGCQKPNADRAGVPHRFCAISVSSQARYCHSVSSGGESAGTWTGRLTRSTIAIVGSLRPPPDAFAVVMATGIVAAAANDHGYRLIANALGWIATLVFVVLTAAVLAGLATRQGGARSPDPGVTLRRFTFVAGCAVLGEHWETHLVALWLLAGLGLGAWLVLVPQAVRVLRSQSRRQLDSHARGAWLLGSVASAGLATNGADLSKLTGGSSLAIAAAVWWVIGVVGYVAVAALIVSRACTVAMLPEDITPDSWILMGALAISALAAGHILAAAREASGLDWLADGMRPMTLVCWVLASAWIPALVGGEIWYLRVAGSPLKYQTAWWASVFPFGMYATATAETAAQLRLRPLETISEVWLWIALAAWLVVAVGLVRTLSAVSARRGRPRPAEGSRR